MKSCAEAAPIFPKLKSHSSPSVWLWKAKRRYCRVSKRWCRETTLTATMPTSVSAVTKRWQLWREFVSRNCPTIYSSLWSGFSSTMSPWLSSRWTIIASFHLHSICNTFLMSICGVWRRVILVRMHSNVANAITSTNWKASWCTQDMQTVDTITRLCRIA